MAFGKTSANRRAMGIIHEMSSSAASSSRKSPSCHAATDRAFTFGSATHDRGAPTSFSSWVRRC